MKSPLISIIIATLNESPKNIDRIINSLGKQSFKNYEIILVDYPRDNDKTYIYAKKTGIKTYKLPINKQKILNPRGAQVNFGISKAMGKIIFFPDTDMSFDTDLLKEIVLKMKTYDALYIPEVIVGDNLFNKVRNFERSFYNQTPIDAVRVVKKSLFEKIKGFDEVGIRFGADDWDLTKRIKEKTKKITITESKLYHHENILTLSQFLKKKHHYAGIFDEYVAKWGKDNPDIKKQLGLRYRALGVFVEKSKWKKIANNPFLFFLTGLIRLVTFISFFIKSKK